MRWLLALCSLALVTSAATAAPGSTEAPPRPVLAPCRLHAWHPPIARAARAGGIRLDPETGPPVGGLEELAQQIAARRRALADVRVEIRPDGSGHAVLGGLARAYTVARITPDGTLVQDCVETEAQVRQLVSPTPAARKR